MAETEVVHLDLPGTHKYLNMLSACLAQFLAHMPLNNLEELSYHIQLAVHETCANIVEHAYEGTCKGRIQITLTLGERCLTVDIHDTGKAFDPDTVAAPNLDEPQVHGYGLFLIQQLMDEVNYNPKPGDNRWRLVKYL
jgi:serine/threonine-protein kinase RsbW